MIGISKNQQVNFIDFNGISLTVKREDLLHPEISGNKYRKLKYNLLQAKKESKNTLLTFGGAYSNHIAAVAAAGSEYGFQTIGIIRGEELVDKISENSTLSFAKKCGMKFEFVSREIYRKKNEQQFLENYLKHSPLWGELEKGFYLIPEGGTNDLAIKGCEEILTDLDTDFDYICVSVGTGGTIAGLINSATTKQKVLGFSALKGNFLTEEIQKRTGKSNWKLIVDYHFGGYSKINSDLITFINQFKEKTGIALDPIYTGKMMYGIINMTYAGYFEKNSKILAIHTGGLQGIKGMNARLERHKLPLII